MPKITRTNQEPAKAYAIPKPTTKTLPTAGVNRPAPLKTTPKATIATGYRDGNPKDPK